jgi:hypothetical protein
MRREVFGLTVLDSEEDLQCKHSFAEETIEEDVLVNPNSEFVEGYGRAAVM